MKSICLIGVFFVHCQLYYGFMFDKINFFIYPFYVNGFFFISGYLLFWKQLSAPKIEEPRKLYMSRNGSGSLLFTNILYRIIIPSIIFSAVTFLPSCIIQDRDINLSFALYKTIGGGTYWFTSALVVAELLLLILFCTRKKKVQFYSVVSLLLTVIGLIIVKTTLPFSNIWAWRQGLLALFFLTLGGVYWKCESFKISNRVLLVVLLILYFTMNIVLEEYCNPLISTLQIKPLGLVTSTIACILLVWICKYLPEIKVLRYIGQNSLGFYFLSGAIPIILGKIANILFSTKNMFILLLVFVISLVLTYIFVMIMNKWFPWLFDLRLLKKNNK